MMPTVPYDFRSPEDFKEQCGYTIDAVWYPRVTKIVSIKAKPALYRYYAEAPNFAAAEAATLRSAEEGTLVHEVIEGHLLGKNPAIPEAHAAAVTAFFNFLAKNHIEVAPEHVERRVVSQDHRYAGTVDALARIGGKFGVLDIKTSQSVYRDYNLQTSAYMDALKNNYPDLETRWILRVDQTQDCLRCGAKRRVKGGREKIRKQGAFICSPYLGHEWSEMRGDIELQEFPSWQSDFEAFLGAKRLWEWENDYWLRKVNYL